MNLIKFFRGPKASYSAASTHKDALYFATDTNELIMNGNSYGDKIKDNGLIFTEVQSGANKGHVIATIELNSGKTFANVDLGVYGRSEVDSKIASVNSDATTLAGRVTTAEGNITSLDTRLTSAEGSITTLTAGSSTEGSVAYQIAQIVANAPASFDTLKEIADWIANDTTGAAKMAADIETLKTGKVDKVTGKQLSTEDYTTAEKTKLAGIEAGAQVNPTNVSAFTNDSKYVTEDDMQVDVIDANGHDYVEIGGIKWATMNIGANSITDTGLYFQWGDAQGYTAEQVGSGEGQKYFGWADYKYGNGTSSPDATGMTKYNSTDGKTVLEVSDDAVAANWGGSWRMPTTAEFQALGAAVDTAWTADYQGSGVAGLVCTDKTDSSKVLFFPAAGSCDNGRVYNVGSYGFYWSSSVLSGDVQRVYYLSFGSIYVDWQDYSYRHNGFAVRPVLNASTGPKYATKAELNTTESTLNTADTTTNTRITNLTGQSGSTYTARSTEDASFIKNATNIQDALNKLDDASMALTTLLTWQEVRATLYYRTETIFETSGGGEQEVTRSCVVDSNGSIIMINATPPGATIYIYKDGNTWELGEAAPSHSYADGVTSVLSTDFDGQNLSFTIDGVTCEFENGQLNIEPVLWVD